MIDPFALLAVCIPFFIIAATPGPATLGVVAVSLSAGRWPGLAFSLGLSTGLALWGVVAATGLGAVLQASATALTAFKLIGGLYLLWLAWGAAKAARHAQASIPNIDARGLWFRRGLLLNLSNPKAVLAWMSVLSLGLSVDQTAFQLVTAIVACVVLSLLIYWGYAIAFSTRTAMALYTRAKRGVDATVAVLFTITGLALIRSALSR